MDMYMVSAATTKGGAKNIEGQRVVQIGLKTERGASYGDSMAVRRVEPKGGTWR